MLKSGSSRSGPTKSRCCGRPNQLPRAMIALLLSFNAGAANAQGHRRPPPPPPPPVVPPGGANITVFHINEVSFGAAPLNMNTGDALGDMYFDLRSKALAIECASGSPSAARDCDNAEVNPPTDDPLVVTKIVLRVTAPYSAYGRCNVCVNGTDHHGNNSCTNGAYWCSCGYGRGGSQCAPGIGRENLTSHYGGRLCGSGSANYECWKEASAVKMAPGGGGTWYSTVSAGYGSSWHVAEVVKRVSKVCADESMNSAVEKAGLSSGCFQKCGPHATGPSRNTSSTCWIECFESTVLGPE